MDEQGRDDRQNVNNMKRNKRDNVSSTNVKIINGKKGKPFRVGVNNYSKLKTRTNDTLSLDFRNLR